MFKKFRYIGTVKKSLKMMDIDPTAFDHKQLTDIMFLGYMGDYTPQETALVVIGLSNLPQTDVSVIKWISVIINWWGNGEVRDSFLDYYWRDPDLSDSLLGRLVYSMTSSRDREQG